MMLKSYVTLYFATIFTLSAQTASVLVPKALDDHQPGKYEILARSESFQHAGKPGVSAQLFIPKTVPAADLSAAPIVVFFHGNSTNKSLYRSAGNFLHTYATQKKFLVLSVQNWWPLAANSVEAIEDSRQATNMILNELAQKKIGDTNAVYATGFSAGGLAALLVFVHSIDSSVPGDKEKIFFNYAGMASFKGNFYGQYFMPNPMFSPDQLKAHYAKLSQGKAIILTVGGKKDAPRVQQQAPEAKQFLEEYLGLAITYKEFPSEGHALPKSNLDLLWQAMGR